MPLKEDSAESYAKQRSALLIEASSFHAPCMTACIVTEAGLPEASPHPSPIGRPTRIMRRLITPTDTHTHRHRAKSNAGIRVQGLGAEGVMYCKSTSHVEMLNYCRSKLIKLVSCIKGN